MVLRESLVDCSLYMNYSTNMLDLYTTDSLSKEKDMLIVSGDLSGSYSDMKSFLAVLNSKDSCSNFASNTTLCNLVFSGFMNHGISMAIMQILRLAQNSNVQLEKAPASSTIWNETRSTEELIQTFDVMSYYLDPALENIIIKFMEIMNDYWDSIESTDNIKFSIFAVFLVIISLIVWLNMLNNLNTDIMRARGVLNILPTYLLNDNADFLSNISKGNIFSQSKKQAKITNSFLLQ